MTLASADLEAIASLTPLPSSAPCVAPPAPASAPSVRPPAPQSPLLLHTAQAGGSVGCGEAAALRKGQASLPSGLLLSGDLDLIGEPLEAFW